MDDDKLAEVLKRARAALKNGRDQRTYDLDATSINLIKGERDSRQGGEAGAKASAKFMREIDQTSARGMLKKDVFEIRDTKGNLVSREMELAETKEREPYQKRPSVRAATTEQTPETKLNLVGNRLNTAIDNRLRKETPEAIDMATYGKIMPETKAMLRYEVYLNKDPMATLNGYQKGDKCQRVRVGKLVQGVSSEKHCAAIFDQYNTPRYNTPETLAKIKRSISVGDVIKIGKDAYAVERVGFRKLESFRVRSRSNERGAGRSI